MDLRQIIKKNLDAIETPTLTFDKIGAFETTTGLGIIHLGILEIPSQFLSMIESMCNDLKDVGCKMFSNFKLHVTFGRVRQSGLIISIIGYITNTVDLQLLLSGKIQKSNRVGGKH